MFDIFAHYSWKIVPTQAQGLLKVFHLIASIIAVMVSIIVVFMQEFPSKHGVLQGSVSQFKNKKKNGEKLQCPDVQLLSTDLLKCQFSV